MKAAPPIAGAGNDDGKERQTGAGRPAGRAAAATPLAYDVLVVGGAGIDTIVQVPALTLPAADSLPVPAIYDYVAHTGNGVALGCLALQLRTKFIDFIGADRQGQLILDRYRERGLDFSHLIHASGTRRSVNLIDPQGRRLSLYDGRHPPELRMPREFYLPHLSATRHAHFSIMHWVRDLYDDAQALGVSVSTDLHDWDGANAHHRDFALRSELVFIGAAALGQRVGEVMAAILRDGRAQAVVAMAGERGSYLLARGDVVPLHCPCAPLQRPVVDSNGAGDSFVAAFLAAWLRGAPLQLALRQGALGGAFACGWHGTHERFIGTDELARQHARWSEGAGQTSSHRD